MTYESTPVGASIEVQRTDQTNCWNKRIWLVILFRGEKSWEYEQVIEDGGFWLWSFESRLRRAQKRLLRKYKLVHELSGPIFIKHG